MREKTSSEKVFQQNLVDELIKYKWTAPDFLDGNKQRVTVGDLINNWREELNRLNAAELEGVPLTDNEFKQVLGKINQINNSYEAAKLLAMENSAGKIDGIYRDKNPSVTKNQITLTIFKKADVGGGDSSYKIAREVLTNNNNRFDLILLINGLPLINIELKRVDKTLNDAFYQFKRYYRSGEYINNFMVMSQMMVIMSEIEMRYFATPKSLNDFNKSFVFNWADKNNNPIHDYIKVVKYFLKIPMAHQMIGDYLVIDESKDPEKRKHMILRPYQVYALQTIVLAARGADNEDGIPRGGFIWHTTGSGKTITSFKSALFLSQRGGFDKVVFLVDRKELDQKTSENFKAYSVYDSVIVDDTKRTSELDKLFKKGKRGIIITTTHKLSALIKELNNNRDYSLQEKRMVFIIDEAHRTTMGDMMGSIKEFFRKKSLFYGFTGTPLFEENKVKGKINEKSELINTTEKLFGSLLHQYTIDEAIKDKNVLGFNVNYLNTGEFISHEDLRGKLIDFEKERKQLPERKINQKYFMMSKADIEREAIKNKLLIYDDKLHIPVVVSEILKNWDKQSQNKFFNAILTVEYKDRVINYYNEFKKQLKEKNINLNIAMTFSFGSQIEDDNVPLEIIEEMFEDYSKFTGVLFKIGDSKLGEKNYFADLVDRSTKGGSSRNETNIDLMIVAEQLLTGYDSKYLNTLYIDRPLKLQSLVQAYSRTNRIYGREKEFGSIVNFMYPAITEENVKKALKLYGSGGTSSIAIVDTYDVAVDKFVASIEKLKGILKNPSDWVILKDTEKESKFLEIFIESSSALNLVKQYYAYQWDNDSFGITEHEWLKYIGAYKNLKPEEEEGNNEIITKLVGNVKISNIQIIDAEHILKLIGEKKKDSNVDPYADQENLKLIYEKIQELSDMGEHMEAMLLKEFIEQQLTSKDLFESISLDEDYEQWKKSKEYEEMFKFSDEWGIDIEILIKSLKNYSLSEPEIVPYIEEISNSLNYENAKIKKGNSYLEHNIKLTNELSKWMRKIKNKY